MKPDWQAITRRWLARLSFSFLIVAFVLVWEGYKRYRAMGNAADAQTLLYFFAAMLSIVLAMTGVRERHRSE